MRLQRKHKTAPWRATRHDKLAMRYGATVHITAISIWLRSGGGFRSDPSHNLGS